MMLKKLGLAAGVLSATCASAVLLPASAATAAPTTCSVSVSYSGAVASAYCKTGTGSYRIQIHCTNLAYYNGNIATPGKYSASTASCGSGVVDAYRILKYESV